MNHIYHIPAWWPSDKNKYNGLFIYELIHVLANREKNYKHTVGVYNTSLKWISASHLFRSIKLLFNRDKPLSMEHSSVQVIPLKRIIGANPLTGINYIMLLIKNHVGIIEQLSVKPDLIHIHVSYPGLAVGHAIAEKFNIPFILTEHSSRFPDHRFDHFEYGPDLIMKMLRKSKSNVAVSAVLAQRFQYYGLCASRVIPNFVNWERPELKLLHKQGSFKFVFIGFMNDFRKRIDILLLSIQLLSRKYPDFKVEIIGDGTELTYYKLLANQTNISKYITWHGAIPEEQKQIILRDSNCMVISSEYETFGIMAIEAASYGLPVLSTRCGGVEEIIDQHNGLLVEKNNPKALADGMRWMIEHSHSFDPISIQSQCYEKFDRGLIAQKYIHLYHSILYPSGTISLS